MDEFTAQLNEAVAKHTLGTLGNALGYMKSMGVVETGKLFQRLRRKLRYDSGEVELIQFSMPRYGFIQQTERALGSSVPAEKENRVATRSGNRYKLTGGTPRPFLTKAIEEDMDQLADIVASVLADRGMRATDIRLKAR